MLQLTTGTYREIEAALLDQLIQARQANPWDRLLVLSPSGHMLNRLQRQAAQRLPAALNIHFLTFYALAERLLVDADYSETIVTEPAVYSELIREILVGEKPEAVDLEIRKALRVKGNTIPKGLAGSLAATMKDLRDSGMRADLALKVTQEGYLGQEAPEAAAALALYARLVGLFEKYQLRSSADLLRRAAARVPLHPWIQSQKAIFLYGFYDLTGVQLDLVLSLAAHPNAQIYFPYEAGNPAYAFAEKLLNDPGFRGKTVERREWRVEGGNVTVESGGSRVEGNSRSAPSTLHSSPSTATPPSTLHSPPFTDVWSCSGARDEVWLAAKEILRLTDDGVPFSEIAVLSRNLGAYLAPLREIFPANEIPFVCSRREPAGSHPLVKRIRATAREKTEPASGTWQSQIDWAKALLLESAALPEKATAEELALFEQVQASLESLELLDRFGIPVTREHFLETWEAKLDALERPGPAAVHDGVQVLDVQEARGLPFRAVFLLGMNEKVFPRLIREDPFLSDAARSALAQATGARLGRKLDGYEEERLLFALSRRAASETLTLTTQRSDDEGKALIPSVYLKDLEGEPNGPKAKRLPRSTPDKFANRSPLLWNPKELSFLVNRGGLDPKAVYQALGWDLAGFYRHLSTHRVIEAFKPGIGAYDGKIEDLSQLKATLAKPFSPTSLEDLAQCPFQYYAGHVLRVKPKEDLSPDGEISPQALGKLFHRTLELYYSGYPKSDLRSCIEACFLENQEALKGAYPLELESAKTTIFKELSAFIKSDLEEAAAAGWRPTWFEQSMEGNLPIPGLDVRFFGKPDRLDLSESEGSAQVRVVDYKSGKPKPGSGRIETHLLQGRFLQLPIYLGLAAQFAAKLLSKPVKAVMASLRPVRTTEEEGTEKTLTAAFWNGPSANLFKENIQELIKLIEKGSFYIEPSTGDWGYCARCDFAFLCRKEHMPSRIRAERDADRNRVRERLSRIAPKTEKEKEPADVA